MPRLSASISSPLAALPVAAALLVPLLYCLFIQRAAHSLPPGQQLVGLVHVDQPAYYACAREPFDQAAPGSLPTLFYASPYSSRPDAPRIYTHFAFLAMGALWRLTGAPLYLLDQSLRLLFGAAMLLLAVATFRRALPPAARNCPLAIAGAVAVAAGGGLAWAAALWNRLFEFLYLKLEGDPGLRSFTDWMAMYPGAFATAEGGYGEWGASPMRVLESVPECIYHTLFFACTWCLAVGRWNLALPFFALAWWSHPFTGVELSAVAGIFLLAELWKGERRPILPLFTGVILVAAPFLAYYLIWLPRFPEHRSVEEQMRGFGNPMLLGKLLPAYGLFLPLAVSWLLTPDFRRAWKEERGVRLMAAWLLAVTLLVFHDRLAFLIRPIQAMHFTRGYLYIPLVYFADRSLLHWLPVMESRWKRTLPAGAVAAALILLHLPDNFLALGKFSGELVTLGSPFSVSRQTAAALSALDRLPGPLTIHPAGRTDTDGLRGLIPVLTPHRTLLPHTFNTPFQKAKRADAERFDETLAPELLTHWGVNAVLADEGVRKRLLEKNPGLKTEALSAVEGWWVVFLKGR